MIHHSNSIPDRKRTLLIVEDEGALRELLHAELSREGYHVVSAADGFEGLDLLQEAEPDVIICDRAMPRMTGYELLERIRGVYPQYAHVPFIFLTALTEPLDRQAVKPLRPYAYLDKPVDFELLLTTIRDALATARP